MSNLFMKSEMDSRQLAIAQSEFEKRKKSKLVAYLLWWFTGVLGGHRFYAGDIGMGIGMLLTLGGIGLWALIDVFFIGSRIEEKNEALEREILLQVGRS